MKKLKLFVIASSFAIFGCDTMPVKTSSAKPIPDSRVIKRPSVTSKNPAKVIVIRDSGFVGSAGWLNLKMNGVLLAKLEPREQFVFSADPGAYVLGVVPNSDVFAGSPAETETTLKEGETAFYRIGLTSQGMILIQRSYEIMD